MKIIDRLKIAVERLFFGRAASDLRWWERRARRRGLRSVYSLGHSRAELEAVTQKQTELLFPLLRDQLRGDEQVVLDFGCGTGRFTGGLASLIDGRAIGVDPIARLLALAPAHQTVEYRLMQDQRIPLEAGSVDVVWICLVLMAITDDGALQRAVSEVQRVLKPGGLVFLVENTQPRPDLPHLCYRSVGDYQRLLSWANLEHLTDYEDVGERISVMAGRTR